MYVPSHFEETRIEVLHDLICAYPFGMLVTLDADGLNANHIPFELDPHPAPFGIAIDEADQEGVDRHKNGDTQRK